MVKNLAHRGMSGIAPENTWTAFNEAKEFKFDGVELDVHLTSDNKLVIIHDEKINRTSDGRGYVKDYTLKELREFNFAKNFAGIKNEKIMTLGEFLKEFATSFNTINIELKTDVYEYEGIEKKVLKEISKYPLEKFILSSFNFITIRNVRALNKDVKIGFLWNKHKNFISIDRKEILRVCNYLHPAKKLFTLPHLKVKYDSFKLPYNIWTIKSKRMFKKLTKNKKVHSVICNYKYEKAGMHISKNRR